MRALYYVRLCSTRYSRHPQKQPLSGPQAAHWISGRTCRGYTTRRMPLSQYDPSSCRPGCLQTGAAAQAGPAAARERPRLKSGTSSARPPQARTARRHSCTLGCTDSFQGRKCHHLRSPKACPGCCQAANRCTCQADHRADRALLEPLQRRGWASAALVAGHVRRTPVRRKPVRLGSGLEAL